MPIVVSRATGEIIRKPELTQADRDRAWEAVVRAFAKRHPELLVQQPAQKILQAPEGKAGEGEGGIVMEGVLLYNDGLIDHAADQRRHDAGKAEALLA